MSDIRASDILFHFGTNVLRRTGRLWRGVGLVETDAPTIIRASDRYFLDRTGLVKKAASGIIGLTHHDPDADGVYSAADKATLIESARTNGWATATEDYADAAWTKTNVTITSNATTAPDGVVASADKVVGSGTGVVPHLVLRNTPTLTDNTRSSVSWLVKQSELAWCRVATQAKDGVSRATWFNLFTATVGTKNAGHDAFVRKLANGWTWVSVTFDAASGATAPKADVLLATGDNVTTYDASVSPGGIFVWHGAVEPDKPFPSEPGSILPNGLARAADALTQSVAFGNVDQTWYWELVRPVHADVTGILGADPGIIGRSTVAPHIGVFFQNSTRNFRARITSGSFQEVSRSIPAGAVLRGALQIKNLATGGQIAIDSDNGSGFSAFSPAVTGFSAFGNQTLQIGKQPITNVELSGGLIALLGVKGLRTLSELQVADSALL